MKIPESIEQDLGKLLKKHTDRQLIDVDNEKNEGKTIMGCILLIVGIIGISVGLGSVLPAGIICLYMSFLFLTTTNPDE